MTASASAAPDGRIEGRLTDSAGNALADVHIEVVGTDAETVTNFDGRFAFDVEPGNYRLELSAGKSSETVYDVAVPFYGKARVDRSLYWPLSAGKKALVKAARHQRRSDDRSAATPADWAVADPPATVAKVTAERRDLEPHSVHGQVPKIVEALPGAYVARGGSFSFNFNTRGFNGVTARRVKVLIDGRDPSEPFFGFQEWAAYSPVLEDLSRVELTRGPSSAVYGPGATGGVLDLVTRSARADAGGQLRLTGGEDDTRHVDLRWTTALGRRDYLKLLGGQRRVDSFSESRVGQAEYSSLCAEFGDRDCLLEEKALLDPDGNEDVTYAAARWDHDFDSGPLFTLETGGSRVKGPVIQTNLGRVQIRDADHQYLRGQYSSKHWSFLGTYTDRQADRQTALFTDDNLALEDETWKGELRTTWSLLDDRALLMAGLSHQDETVDSVDRRGPRRPSLLNGLNRQTLMFEPAASDSDGFWASIDWHLSDKLSLTTAARYDDGSLYDPQWSGRVSLAIAPSSDHTFRFTYHDAFQVPSYADYFLNFDLEPALNLSFLEPICVEQGVACGFDVDFTPAEDPAQDVTADTRILAAGNLDLEVEETESLEIGYAGRLSDSVHLSVDYHFAKHKNFVTDLLPQLGTSLGRVNSAFQGYAPPDRLTPDQAGFLLAELDAELARLGRQDLRPFLTTTVDGTPVFVVRSLTNLGKVETQGLDVAFDWDFSSGWSLAATYSWLEFDIDQGVVGLDDQLRPNTPENKATLALSYAGAKWGGRLASRWFDDFRWASGPFNGVVESSTVVDASADLRLSAQWLIGFYISNLLDEEYYASFGGDVLRRRAHLSLSVDW